MHQRSHLKPQIKLMNDKKYSYYSIQLNVPKVVLKRLGKIHIIPLSSALIQVLNMYYSSVLS